MLSKPSGGPSQSALPGKKITMERVRHLKAVSE